MRVSWSILLVGVAACGFNPHPQNGALPCDNGCPSGYHCAKDGTCRTTELGSGGVTATGGLKGSGGIVGAGGNMGTSVGGTTPSSSSGSTTPPSCLVGGVGTTECGAASENCCTSLEVMGGEFYRTYTNDGSGPTAEADPATVSSFRLDKYLVTVGRFRKFVAAWNNGWTPPAGSGKHTHLNGGWGLANAGSPGTYESGWVTTDNSQIAPTDANLACAPFHEAATWTNTSGGQENLPINCVNWWEAYAFCIWDGGWLPSEAEWEYAAAGGSQQREYPWGSTAPGRSNCCASVYDCDCTGVGNVAPVGAATLGAGLWGQLDLAGELNEWNLDWYASYVNPCTDCAYLTVAFSRVNRGSDFGVDDVSRLVTSRRGYSSSGPAGRYDVLGFRCARTP
ncbi:MAG: SUMF1/EgtB/PvdO family nonheme iron enzyme [Polyangia bacterium]